MKLRLILSVLIAGLLAATTNLAVAGKTLNDAELKALFSGKTFDGHNENKNKDYRAYSAADGTMLHQNPRRTKETTWKIENGQHCAKLRGWRCGTIVDMGGGVYHKLKDGEHINTLTNFVEGNQL